MVTAVATCPVCGRDYVRLRVDGTPYAFCSVACQLTVAREAHYPEPETPAQYRARLAAAAARRPDLAERWGVSV